jgi:hypothetical protein
MPKHTRSLIQLTNKNQAAIGNHTGTLETNLERGVDGERKELILRLTNWFLASAAFSSRSHQHEY